MLMKSCSTRFSSLLLLTLVVSSGDVYGQLFGERTIGRTLTSAPNARIPARLRRPPSVFVGPDRQDTRRFIGAGQVGPRGAIRSAVTGVPVNSDSSAAINTALPQASQDRAYWPRLSIEGLETRPLTASEVNAKMRHRFEGWMGRDITVSVVGRTAILRGTVATAKERRLAAILAKFEPGVSTVRNDLKVADGTASPATLPSPR